MRKKLIVWLSLLLAGFLGGFIPQYSQVRRLNRELDGAKQKLQVLEPRERLAGFFGQSVTIYFETAHKNYGLAAGQAREFFGDLSHFANQTQDAAPKKDLEDVLGLRDKITAGLAKADPSVLPDLETVVLKMRQSTTQ